MRGGFELPLGFPMMELINDVCGGIRDGRKLKAVIPGGSSVPILHAAPLFTMCGIAHSVSTLLTLVGMPNAPTTAG